MKSISSPAAHARSLSWIVVAHALGGALIGALETVRLGTAALALVFVPIAAATGLVVGLVLATVERLVARRRPAIAALALAAPSLLITVPVCGSAFDGAYARTLPLASVLPYLVPIVAWLGLAAAVAVGRRLAAGDLIARSIPIVVAAGVAGVALWGKRLLGTGYPALHVAATLAVVVVAGVVVRLARRARPPRLVAVATIAIALGCSVAAALAGLAVEADRRLVVARGGAALDLVHLWRGTFDLDADGSSALLGGGDCDDRDPAVRPGARDEPADGIDQDCDGEDAIVVAPAAPRPAPAQLVDWRSSAGPQALLARTRGMNVVLVTVDALRFDLLAPGAAHREDFPRLTALLDESVFFTRAFSAASGTDLAMATLFSGLVDPFRPLETVLPEAIRALDRYTSCVLPVEVQRYVGEIRLARGWDRVRNVYTDWDQQDVGDHVSSGATTDEARKAIDAAQGRPFFVWAHYFDVHEHHQIQVPASLRDAVHPGASKREHRYRALLLAADRAIGALLDDLARRGIADRTIVVFASDHGESLLEDPRLLDTHGKVAYHALVHVPLAIRVPGVPGAVRTDLTSLVDIAPTLLELLGAPAAMGALDGYSLVPAMLDAPAALRPPADRALVIHEELQWSVVEWPYQLLVKPADDLVELYDLERDPACANDLAAARPEITRRLRARYVELPAIALDRSATGRAWREQQARPPPPRARP